MGSIFSSGSSPADEGKKQPSKKGIYRRVAKKRQDDRDDDEEYSTCGLDPESFGSGATIIKEKPSVFALTVGSIVYKLKLNIDGADLNPEGQDPIILAQSLFYRGYISRINIKSVKTMEGAVLTPNPDTITTFAKGLDHFPQTGPLKEIKIKFKVKFDQSVPSYSARFKEYVSMLYRVMASLGYRLIVERLNEQNTTHGMMNKQINEANESYIMVMKMEEKKYN